MNEPSRLREILWDIYYSNYLFAWTLKKLSNFISYLYPKYKDCDYKYKGYIYQGYGACYVLTKTFFNSFKKLWAPCFLDGEEFHLAMQLEVIDQKMYYWPSLKVLHKDHASTSKIPGKLYWNYSRESFNLYRKFVIPYRYKMRKRITPYLVDPSFEREVCK